MQNIQIYNSTLRGMGKDYHSPLRGHTSERLRTHHPVSSSVYSHAGNGSGYPFPGCCQNSKISNQGLHRMTPVVVCIPFSNPCTFF